MGDYTALLDSAAKASMRVLSDDRTLEDFKNIEMWMKRVRGATAWLKWGSLNFSGLVRFALMRAIAPLSAHPPPSLALSPPDTVGAECDRECMYHVWWMHTAPWRRRADACGW